MFLLHKAAREGQLQFVEYLLESGVKIDEKDNPCYSKIVNFQRLLNGTRWRPDYGSAPPRLRVMYLLSFWKVYYEGVRSNNLR